MSRLLNLIKLPNKSTGGQYTSTEITRQPETWTKVWEKILSKRKELVYFLKDIVRREDLNIILTGAGSSAFIGDAALSAWLNAFSRNTQVIPTTDLVTHFEQRIVTDKPLLLISFARSGNSPESTAAVHIADKVCSQVYHLVITCNAKGKLAQLDTQKNACVFLLPEEAEDKSLAMTNSFTSMALTAVLIPKLFSSETHRIGQQVQKLAQYGEKLINDYIEVLFNASQTEFDRIIFLGSGPLWGIAKESHLKVQELTNGKVVGKFDSFLGFRHGPKAIINDKTLLVYLLSNNPETHNYERDLINQIARHNIDLVTMSVSEIKFNGSGINYAISLNNSNELDEDLWAILCTLPAQIIGFYKSLALSYNPDNPSPDGTISRVVEGVKIYDGVQKHAQK